MSYIIPNVIEKDPRGGERGYDVYSRLLRDRKRPAAAILVPDPGNRAA